MTTLLKLPKNVGDLGKLILAKVSKKLPNLVTLVIVKAVTTTTTTPTWRNI